MQIKLTAICCLAMFCCLTCKSSLDIPGFVKYVEDPENGLHIQKQTGRLKLDVQYKPLEYVALQNDPSHSLENISKGITDIQGYRFFTVRVATTDGSALLEGHDNSEQHFEKLSYCEFSMQKDFRLVEGSDTIPCDIYHFERNYNLAHFSSFVLAFPEGKTSKESKSDITLLFEDKIFGLGNTAYTIKGKDIYKIPTIKNLF